MVLLTLYACSCQPEPDATADSDGGEFGLDDDCDDADRSTTWFRDLDHDAYGDVNETEYACAAPSGFVATAGDCDDDDDTVHPGASELCDGKDNDCDASKDEDFDQDGDGYAPYDCPSGDDCDDTNDAVHPDATEVCGDGIDANCAGGDTDCPLSGDYALADVTKIYSDEQDADMARQLAVGDIDGDGTLDVLASAETANDAYGGGFILYGPLSGTHRTADVGYAAMSSAEASATAGRSVGVGDLDDDGYADIEIGAPLEGEVFIELGPIEDDFDLADASIQMWTNDTTLFGHGSAVADVNGDGVADVLVGAYAVSSGDHGSGSVFVDFGPLSAGEDVPMNGHDAELYGSTPDLFAGRVLKAGADMDGDGVGDVLVEAINYPKGVPIGGVVLVVHGPLVGDADLADADATLVGVVPLGVAGAGLAQGDLDGDGLADALVGAPIENPSGKGVTTYDGAAYVVSGATTDTVELTDADVIVHGTSGGWLGSALAVGDLDGDGRGELLVSAPNDVDYAGATLVFYDAMPGAWDDTDAAARLVGEEWMEGAGTALLVTDLDANGRDELLVGAPGNSTGAARAGALYVLAPF